MAEQNVEVEGINYYTLLEGPDDQNDNAPCVLLCHALMSNLHMWDSTVRTLNAAGFRTLRFDHVGHHNTPPPQTKTTDQRRMSLGGPLAYHMDDITRHMHQLVKARLGQENIRAVVGCSIGGVLALRYAMMFPGDVEQIISIAAPGVKAPEEKKKLWSQRIQLFEEDQKNGMENLCHATVERWFPCGRPEDDAAREESLTHVRSCSLQGYKLLADTIRNYDYEGEEEKVSKVKSLITGGDEDGAISLAHLKELAGKIQGAEYVEIEKAGHLPPMQKPEEFGELMLRFLGSP